MKNKKINNLLMEVSEKFNKNEDYFLYMRFMLDCLSFIQDDCPDIGKNSISIAEDFFEGKSNVEELTRARVACWEFLEKKKKNAGSRKIENNQMRSVICVLRPHRDPDDFFDILDWFCEHFCETASYESVVLEKLKLNFDVD
jgi:hypothetical protein